MNATARPKATKLFRPFKTENGRPRCGSAASMLGVRTTGPVIDIAPDEAGQVHPGRGGMSVTPDNPSSLPPFLRPTWLGGHGSLPLFVIDSTALGTSLLYRPDPARPTAHGFVEPVSAMALTAYVAALAATSSTWKEVSQ